MASLYNRLLDQLLLPPLVKRMEYVLADAIARQDSKAAYDALRIYLLLNLDKDHEDKYNAAEIQSWVINDLGNSDSVAGFGGRAAVLTHIEALFDGSRVVHSPYEKDEALIRRRGHSSTVTPVPSVSTRGRWRQWRAKRRRSSRWYAPSARMRNGLCA